MDKPVIEQQLNEGIAVLTLNRPDKRNALNIDLLQALTSAIHRAEEQQRRAVIIQGSGKVFCAGLDLQEASEREKAHTSAEHVASVLKAIYNAPFVTIAAVHGVAIAGGAGLMAACDLAVATPECRIGYPETRRGLVAGLVMSFLIRQVGDRLARDLLLTGRLIDGTTAHHWGLANGTASEERLLDQAYALAQEVAKGAPQATARTKKLLATMHPPTVDKDIELALEHHLKARNSAEAEEGIRAFLEKRDPSWQPQESSA